MKMKLGYINLTSLITCDPARVHLWCYFWSSWLIERRKSNVFSIPLRSHLSSPPRSPLGSCHSDGFNPNKLIYLSISARPIICCGLWSNPGAELCEEEWDRTYLNTVMEIARCRQHSQTRTSLLVLSWTVSSGWFEFWLLSLFWFICLAVDE